MTVSAPRLALAADLAAIEELTRAAYSPYTALLGAPPLPVTEDYRPRIDREEIWLLDDGPEGAAGGLSGLIVLETHPDHVMVFSVAVAPSSQGLGLGVRLLGFAEEQTAKAGLSEVRLYTNARMERNIALYRSLGFVETGRRPNPMRPGWTVVDMLKRLRV